MRNRKCRTDFPRFGRRAPRLFVAVLCVAVAGCGGRDGGGGGDASAVVTVFGGVGMGRGEFSYPRGLSVSPVDGCVFVVDKAARIQRFSPTGAYEAEWRMPEFELGKPTGLCVDRRNHVWVADTHYSRVIVFDRDGREVLRFGSTGRGAGEFLWPTNICIDEADQTVLVGEYGGNDRVNRYSLTGRFLSSFASGDESAGGTSRPQGLAVDGGGVVWVADAAHHRVCRYNHDGRFL